MGFSRFNPQSAIRNSLMYLASFELGDARLVQGCLRFPCLPPVADRQRRRWWDEFGRLMGAGDAVPGGDGAVRVVLGGAADGGLPDRLLFATAPASAEADLRRHLASFTRLDHIIEGSVEAPRDRGRHDEWAAGFPALQCRVGAGGFGAGDAWFACDFRVLPLLDELLAEADALGHRFGYQAHVRRLDGADARLADWVRVARKNALRARGLAGVPAAVAAMQQRLADGLAAAAAVVEEFVGADTPAAADWLGGALRRHFARRFGPLRFAVPDFEFAARAHDDQLAAALHSFAFANPTAEELCATAVDDAGRAAVLNWRPADALADRFAARAGRCGGVAESSSDGVEAEAGSREWGVGGIVGGAAAQTPYSPHPTPHGPSPDPATSLPEPYDGQEPFLFVSYKRQDMPRIAPILRRLVRDGHNVWYDKGIPGGSEWDAQIEERLTACRLVLLFVSQAAVRSKYVRREVKFADMLDKPLLSVKLEEAALGDGMNMLLTQYQMVDAAAADFDPQLRRAIHYLAGRGAT